MAQPKYTPNRPAPEIAAEVVCMILARTNQNAPRYHRKTTERQVSLIDRVEDSAREIMEEATGRMNVYRLDEARRGLPVEVMDAHRTEIAQVARAVYETLYARRII
jgi:hypothetical protein